MIYFDALTESDCEQIRQWRNEDISAARTPFLLTDIMQSQFYHLHISDRKSPHRYWAVCEHREADNWHTICEEGGVLSFSKYRQLLGIAGLTDIEWENGRAEIALMIAPDVRGNGYGKQAFEQVKTWGFERMRLHSIYACVYGNNANLVQFWRNMQPTECVRYPGGKFWDGEYYPAYHMTWIQGD